MNNIPYEEMPREIDRLLEENEELKRRIENAKEFIDQILQYHLQPFDYKQVDEDINTLIGILRGVDSE